VAVTSPPALLSAGVPAAAAPGVVVDVDVVPFAELDCSDLVLPAELLSGSLLDAEQPAVEIAMTRRAALQARRVHRDVFVLITAISGGVGNKVSWAGSTCPAD
jgi:hypothetical protein